MDNTSRKMVETCAPVAGSVDVSHVIRTPEYEKKITSMYLSPCHYGSQHEYVLKMQFPFNGKLEDFDNKSARSDLAHRERLWPFASAAKFGSDRQNLD